MRLYLKSILLVIVLFFSYKLESIADDNSKKEVRAVSINGNPSVCPDGTSEERYYASASLGGGSGCGPYYYAWTVTGGSWGTRNGGSYTSATAVGDDLREVYVVWNENASTRRLTLSVSGQESGCESGNDSFSVSKSSSCGGGGGDGGDTCTPDPTDNKFTLKFKKNSDSDYYIQTDERNPPDDMPSAVCANDSFDMYFFYGNSCGSPTVYMDAYFYYTLPGDNSLYLLGIGEPNNKYQQSAPNLFNFDFVDLLSSSSEVTIYYSIVALKRSSRGIVVKKDSDALVQDYMRSFTLDVVIPTVIEPIDFTPPTCPDSDDAVIRFENNDPTLQYVQMTISDLFITEDAAECGEGNDLGSADFMKEVVDGSGNVSFDSENKQFCEKTPSDDFVIVQKSNSNQFVLNNTLDIIDINGNFVDDLHLTEGSYRIELIPMNADGTDILIDACASTYYFEVPNAPVVTFNDGSLSDIDILCNEERGSVTVSAYRRSGDSIEYQLLKSGAAYGNTITAVSDANVTFNNIGEGSNYSIQARYVYGSNNSNYCNWVEKDGDFSVSAIPDLIAINTPQKVKPTCHGGDDAKLRITPDGGKQGYDIWLTVSGNGYNQSGKFERGDSYTEFTGLTGGLTYNISAKLLLDDSTNPELTTCDAVTQSVTMDDRTDIGVTINQNVAPTCPGGNDGFLIITLNNIRGVSSIGDIWVDNVKVNKTATSEGTNKFKISGLSGGDKVKFIAEDLVNSTTCEKTTSEYTISQNNSTPLKIKEIKEFPGTCYTDDASIRLLIEGGIGPFEIYIDGNKQTIGGINSFVKFDSIDIGNIHPTNAHSLRIVDKNTNGSGSEVECDDTDSFGPIDDAFTIANDPLPSPNGNTTYQIRCYDELAPVTFTLSGYGTGQRLAVFNQSNDEIDTLSQSLTGSTGIIMFPEGSFTVKGIDQNCTTQNSLSIVIDKVDNPLEFEVASDVVIYESGGIDYSVSKFGESDGVIMAKVQGGLPIYEVELLIDGVSIDGTEQYSDTPNSPIYFNNLKARDTDGNLINYSIRVTDQLLCSEESAIINLTEPDDLTISFNKNTDYAGNVNITCAGGTDLITVNSDGGIYPHYFTLSNTTTGDNYYREIPSNETVTFSGLYAGDYTLQVVDKYDGAYDVDDRDDATIVGGFELIEPDSIEADTTMSPPTCFQGSDGEFSVEPSGGVPNNNGEYLITFYDSDKNPIPGESGWATELTLVATSGDYFYTIIDDLDGCPENFVPFSIDDIARLEISSLTHDYAPCAGDNAAILKVQAINGRSSDGTYTVELYDDTDNLLASEITSASGYYAFEDLFIGDYRVKVLDDEGCSVEQLETVKDRFDSLVITETVIEPSTCANSDNAKLRVYAFGGDGKHLFSIDNQNSWREADSLWTDENGYLQSTVLFDSLESGGIYEVLLKDTNYYAQSFDNSCLISKTDTISITPQLLLNVEKEDVSCYDATDGSLSIYPSYGDEKSLSFFDIKVLKNGDLFAENILELTDLAPANYKVEVRLSAEGACGVVARKEVSISRSPLPLYADVQSTTNYNCANPSEIVVRGNVEGGWPKNGYEYKFNNGTYEPFVPNLSAFRFTESLTIGEHVLTIRDSKGCKESTIFTVEPLNFSVEVLKQTDVSCYGGNDGLLQLTSTNGNLAYKLWNATDSFKIAATDTALFDAVPAGNFQLVASSGTCISDTLNFTFNSPDEITIDYTILNQPTCGEANGEVVTNISGGVAPYTTNWLYKGGQLLAADALMAGDYIVIVEDAMGCQKRDSVYLEEQTDLSATVADISQATCGAANASVTLNITGGVPGYSIEWYNSQNALVGNGSLLSNISKGTYYYQLSDQSGCAITDTVFVGGDEALSVSIANATQATCGIANGSVSLSVTGGNAPYIINWPTTIPVTNGLSASGLKGGIVYEVLVTDSTDCEQTFKFSINNKSGPELSINQFNPSCGLANGIIEITSATGKEPLFIKWNGVSDMSQLKTGLGEGTYTVTVTDADSCSTTKVVELEEDLSNQLTVSNSITPSSCGGSNGVIELNIRGGFAPYQISWDDNASITEGRRTNLAAGTYEVTITDSVGCQLEKSIVLNEVASPLLTVESFVQASCGTANGSIVLSQLSNDYRYHWSHEAGITTNSAEGLSAGKYDIYAENGSCTTDTLSFYITSPGTDLNISVVETVAATCESTYDGAAEISISGGVSPYTISWNDEQNQNIERASNLLPGTYTVLVTDASGCSAVKSVTVGTVNPIYIASFNKETPSCHTATDGSIEVVVAGGTGNYSYLWSTGASSKTLTGIAAGTYSVEVFDNDECAVSESVTIIAPDSLSLQASVAAPRCYESANGSAELSINGGTAPYSVSWPDGNTSLRRYDLLTGDYTVEVTDENGCSLTQVVTVPQKDSVTISYNIQHASCFNANDAGIELTSIGNARSPLVKWSNGQRGPVLRNVTAGNYTATITDAYGCATAFEFTITEPDLLELVNVEAAATKCNDASNGSITYEVKGGTAPYTYRWSDGAISKNRSGLRAGTYEVLVTDNAGCAIAESFEIGEPDPLLITAELTGVSCFGSADGQATIEVNGGTAPYQISWPDGETTFTREDLTAGRYDVTITDANNCSLTQRLTIDNINPIEIESISRDIPSCYQGSDGSISIEVAGGSGDYTISWENGAQGATITNIAAGTYAVTITDGNGCTFNGSIRLDDAAPINISQLIVADPICYDEPSGMVAVTPSGGSAPYKVIWEDGIEALERNDLLAGTHNFTIQDAEGCTTAYEVTMENPPLEELSNLPEIVYLCTGGYITLDAGNWDTYSWTSDNTFSSTEREVRIDAEGNYHIEVTNEAGCIDAHDIEVIKDDDLLQADFLLTSEAVVGDTVLIIDISWPMPSTVEWFNPDDKDFYLVSQEADYQEVIFTRAGEFEMSMKANLDQCEAYVTKTINVLSQDEAARKRAEAASKSQGKLHLSTSIYPNPNYGTFRLEVEGNQQHDIDVRIVDLHKGYEYYQLSGKQQQKHVFNITDDRLPAGVYIAVIETNGQTISKRFVVK